MEITIPKDILGVISALILTAGYIPYILGVLSGKKNAHPYSWLAWSITSCTLLTIQIIEGAGAGAFVMFISAFFSIATTIIAFNKRHQITIAKHDTISLFAALFVIPIWVITENALLAVLLLCINHLFAFAPTFRKTFIDPHSENMLLHTIAIVSFLISLTAIDIYSWATIMYPVSLCIINSSFALMVIFRQYQIRVSLQPA